MLTSSSRPRSCGILPKACTAAELFADLEQFASHLKARTYKAYSVRSYKYCIGRLLKIAKEHGWKPPPEVMPRDWEFVLSFVKGQSKPTKSIVSYAIRSGKRPSTFSEDDLSSWCQMRVREGFKLASARGTCSTFRLLLGRRELAHLKPRVGPAPGSYGVRLAKMHPSLRLEIEELMVFWTSGFNPDRSGKPLRPATTEILTRVFTSIVGFFQNIRNQDAVESLSKLVTRNNITQYVTWAASGRGILEHTIGKSLGALRSALQNNPRYKDLDLSWVRSMIKQLQKREQSDIDANKQKKLISFADAEAIPRKIREARVKATLLNPVDLAASHRDELLMLWLHVLPWRQRNLRECRLTGANPNLYLAPAASHSGATRPKWLEAQEKASPGANVWQISFNKRETKGKHDVRGCLPHDLAVKLNEYLQHRDALIPEGQPDAGTLFLKWVEERCEQRGYRLARQTLDLPYWVTILVRRAVSEAVLAVKAPVLARHLPTTRYVS